MATCLTLDDLMRAALECAKGVRWKASVGEWVAPRNLALNCMKLLRELEDGSYRPGPYTVFEVTEPKRRKIRSPRFRDRVVQRAMCNCGLYADLTRSNIYDNAACQVGKGTSFAVRRLARMLRAHWRKHGTDGWVLRLDVSKFFDSLPHAGLKALVKRLVRNPEFARLVCQIIDTFADPGIGLGSQISQLLAIAYLSPLDHLIKERLGIRCYIRYSDDMVLVAPDRATLQAAWREIAAWLAEHGLSLNPKSALFPLSQGVRFLKFRYRLTRTGKVLLLPARRNAVRIRRRLKRLLALGRSQAARTSFESWAAHAAWGNAHNQTRRFQQWLQSRLLPTRRPGGAPNA